MNDRFSPPLAGEAGHLPPSLPPPRRVTLAVRLLWASLGLGIPSVLYELSRTSTGGDSGGFLAVQLAVLGFAAYVNISVSRAKNWARIFALVFTVLELGSLFLGPTSPSEAVIETICNWVAAALDAGAMYLLFTASAPPWFGQSKAKL